MIKIKTLKLVWAFDTDWHKGQWMERDAAQRGGYLTENYGLVDSRYKGILRVERNCQKDNCAHESHPEFVMTNLNHVGAERW